MYSKKGKFDEKFLIDEWEKNVILESWKRLTWEVGEDLVGKNEKIKEKRILIRYDRNEEHRW